MSVLMFYVGLLSDLADLADIAGNNQRLLKFVGLKFLGALCHIDFFFPLPLRTFQMKVTPFAVCHRMLLSLADPTRLFVLQFGSI